ncbi:MAG TPA: glycosyltransferase, partial [Candidatus Binatia bacterium]
LPDVELIKVGRAHFEREREHLIKLADQLGVRTAIHFVEEVSEDDLVSLYNLAEVCVMPSLYEGFGFPVLEAMACGTLVVYANAGSLPEIAGTAAICVSPCDARSLAGALLDVLDERANKVISKAHRRAQAARFTWSATVKNTAAVYRRLLS